MFCEVLRRRLIFPLPVLILALSAVACGIDPIQQSSSGKVVIHATISEDLSPTKTSVQPDGKVFWTPDDDFYVYSVADIINGFAAPVNFETSITRSSAAADFSGVLDIDEGGTYIALYPGSFKGTYSYWGEEASGIMSGSIQGHLTPDQNELFDTESAGFPFDFDGNAMMAAISENTENLDDMHFMSICSGLKFSLSSDGISAVRVRGNDGESLAGDFDLDFTFDNIPIVTLVEGSEAEVELSSLSGNLSKGEWLYLLVLPQTFEHGITISFKVDGSWSQSVVIDKPVEFKRGIWKKAENLDLRANAN